MKFSLLDLAPVPEGTDVATALKNSADLAQKAEGWGYHRFWLAEHHNMPGIASAATAVMIGHIASVTSTMRVGAGGIMLPNHAPYMVAEAFGTLAELYGPRIDLGLGRAPGTDMLTARALRRGKEADNFPEDVQELLGYLHEDNPDAKLKAVPGIGTKVPVWLLGSSLYGAQLAASLGLPYAFASHFAPAALGQALDVYRRSFRPSPYLDAPYAIMAANVFAGETDAEGTYLRTTMQQAFARLHLGMPGKLPAPVEEITSAVHPELLPGVNAALAVSATGSPSTVRSELEQMVARFEPDELILTGQIHDHSARLRSFEIAAEILRDF
ncbi:Alkanal monooxygenase alpha chain [Tritonibacter multivorans]|uniref:Luciferase-like monooxygenase n=1 Tax=Tritonibacter multivorans TaxID=928856 RepID=A0A0P1H1F6_9RHOB|nr:LLM class flavin-dependent oxidoreductase [Tritonibacter multivorans]MDA7420847.1 LLM class flavin-dependent oxidoreductase [Tritonibacter multivorans]CUH80636.1 Alkanal monooxygenase alpha chain [Tritonibacter multivorans]SFC84702.1 luciferase family oxidoreductase, group 1 [Tritonibacter multivorans]